MFGMASLVQAVSSAVWDDRCGGLIGWRTDAPMAKLKEGDEIDVRATVERLWPSGGCKSRCD